MKDIFISYKMLSGSKATAAYIYDFLTKKGYQVFLDKHEIKQGEFDVQLYKYIDSAKDVIILLEERSLSSCFQTIERTKGISYKDDWFCKEIMYAIEKKKRIVPLLLDGYKMPDEKELPTEMKSLTKQNALSFDIVDIEHFYDKYFIGQGYLSAKPSNYYMSSFRGDGIADFLFYSNADCDIYEFGKLVAVLDRYTSGFDEENPFVLPVKRSGEHRFKVVNHDTCEEQSIKERITKNSQKYIEIKWSNMRCLWNFTEDDIQNTNNVDDLYDHGIALYKGNSKHTPNYELSFECLKKAASMGDIQSQNFLCTVIKDVYRKWCNNELSDKCVDEWIDMAIGYGSEQGYYMKAIKLYDNKDYESAKKYFKKSVDLFESADSNNMLGLLYESGKGVEINYHKAFTYYEKAAKKGNSFAQGNIGRLYIYGYGVEQNYYLAKEWLVKAAEQGDYSAMCSLGAIYLHGWCGEVDFEKAYDYYIKSADMQDPFFDGLENKGYPQAQHSLGYMFYMGYGVSVDKEKAYEWFLKAAHQNIPESQLWIGIMHFKGEHVKKDIENACWWLKRAYSNSNDDRLCDLIIILLNSICNFPESALSEDGVVQIKENYETLISESDDDYKLYLIFNLYDMKLYEESAKLIEYLKNIDEVEDETYIETIAEIYDYVGNYSKAIKFYDKYINYLENIDNYEMVTLVRNKKIKAREKLQLSINQNS